MLHTPAHRAAPSSGQLLSVTTMPAARPGLVVVEVTGEVDAYTAPALEVCLHSQATQRGVRTLVVDLSRVSFLGAAGVTVLAQVQRRCRMSGVRLIIRTGGRRNALRPLQLSGLADVVDDDPAAVEPLQTKGPGTGPRPHSRPRRSATHRPLRRCR
jgi:anti-sigma B factor antagonist